MLRKVFPILAMSIFSAMLGMGIIIPMLPLYANSMGATGIWIGVIFSSFGISQSILMPVIGRLSDRRGRKLFICVGLFLYALLSMGYLLADRVGDLAFIRFVHGGAGAMVLPIAQAYIGDITPKGEEGRWQEYFNASLFTGFGSGPLIGGVITDHFGMNASFYTMAALNFLAFLLALCLLPEIRRHRERATDRRSSFRTLSGSKVTRAILSFQVTGAFARGASMCFLPIFASLYLNLSPGQVGILIAANILVMSFFQLFMGRLADRFDRKGLVIFGGSIGVAYLALIPQMDSFWQLLALTCFTAGLGGAVASPAASALMVGEGRRYGMGTAMGVYQIGMSIGMTTGPILSGAVVELFSINSAFYLGAGVGLLGIIAFAWFLRQRK